MTALSSSTLDAVAPRLDATARLLLLLAKVDLNPAQRNEARTLAAKIVEWDEFVRIAGAKFSLTLSSRHLRACAADVVPAAVLQELGRRARGAIVDTLRIAGAQVAFHKACIETTHARHAYIKGLALAATYYPSFAERFCRDIDVLVHAQDFDAVVQAAVGAGYRVVVDWSPRAYAEQAQDIRFLTRYADVVAIIGAHGVLIEIHRRLDKMSLHFNERAALTQGAPLVIGAVSANTLPAPLHFTYACYHNARHFWSHLHWLADLDAMIRADDFDRTAVERCADKCGIGPTIAAAFELHHLVSTPGLWGEHLPPNTGGGQFLKACLANLNGALDLENELRAGMELNEFMSTWQISPGRRFGLWSNSWLRRLRPTAAQYFDHKYPAPLHWLYSIENLFDLGRNAVGRAAKQLGSN